MFVKENPDRKKKFRVWDNYHLFLIASLLITRLLFDNIYHLRELPFDWLIDDGVGILISAYLMILQNLSQNFNFHQTFSWHNKQTDSASA